MTTKNAMDSNELNAKAEAAIADALIVELSMEQVEAVAAADGASDTDHPACW